MYDFNLGRFFLVLIFVGAIAAAILIFGFQLIFSKNYIESNHKIIPDYRLKSSGHKIDTVWIYKY